MDYEVTTLVDTVDVMQLTRAIHADADEKIVFLEEYRPVVIQ